MSGYASVAIAAPLAGALTYAVPEAMDARARRGTRVLVPFRAGARTGVVLARHEALPEGLDPARVRPIHDVLDDAPAIPEAQLALCEWIAGYYLAPIGECVRLALPPDGVVHAARRVQAVAAASAPADARPDSPAARALLDAARSAGVPLEPAALVKAVRGALHADLDHLERLGLVVSEYAAERGHAARTVRRYTLRTAAGRLGAAQQRVVEHLQGVDSATADELREACGATKVVLDALVARGAVDVAVEELLRDPFDADIPRRAADPALSPAQQAAVDTVLGATRPVLLHGVTGSGKTEVYMRAARATLARGARVLVLLPEIALTPQFVGVFRAALGARVAVQHSGLSPGARFDQWRRIRRGEVDVVIGARSALFAPLDNVGLIVVDEEHDPSFKQQDGVMYHARDAAVVFATRLGVSCVLGSATPSLESLNNARRDRYALAELRARVEERPMPRVDIVDMATQDVVRGTANEFVSPMLAFAVREAARRGEQSILFLNRRGFAPTVACEDCGEALRCKHCDISMTWHRRRDVLVCHYCGHTARRPTACPTCGSANLGSEGAGTEQIEDVVEASFADLRVARLDRDTARGDRLTKTLDRFRAGDIDVLVGTQIVAKGHDFPRVTVVGVIDADQALRFPDFRSGERTFQLLSQVAGRAGRHDAPGIVIVQTYRPEHFVLDAVAHHDFDTFAARELPFRQRLGYPPYGHLFVLRFDAEDHGAAWRAASALTEAARRASAGQLIVSGPVDAPIARVRGRYRVQSMVRGTDRAAVHRAARAVVASAATLVEASSGVRWSIDVDAVRLL